MADTYLVHQQDPTLSARSFDERFSMLVAAEHLYRDNRALARRLTEAKLRMPPSCLEDLVAERRLTDLIKPRKDRRVLEASGVIVKDGSYYVICDNIRRIARVHVRTFVAVSDLSKGDYAKRCRTRDQSIHVFRLPAR